jgi:hypothetical protein
MRRFAFASYRENGSLPSEGHAFPITKVSASAADKQTALNSVEATMTLCGKAREPLAAHPRSDRTSDFAPQGNFF